MDLALLAVALGYVLPVAALALIATSRTGTSSLAWVLVLLPAFYLAHYYGLKALQGWPTGQRLPPRFDVLAEQVIEPDERSGEPGAVFLWVRAPGQQRPRAYRLPYSKALHREADQAGQRRAAGTPQTGVRVERDAQRADGAGGRHLPVRIMDRLRRRPPPKPPLEAEKNRP